MMIDGKDYGLYNLHRCAKRRGRSVSDNVECGDVDVNDMCQTEFSTQINESLHAKKAKVAEKG
jgi:hypothetical protein